jgi:hypothetical protein
MVGGRAANDNAPCELPIICPCDWTACPFLGANARTWIDPGAYRHVCFSGEGGTGKSLVALQLAVAMALGTK